MTGERPAFARAISLVSIPHRKASDFLSLRVVARVLKFQFLIGKLVTFFAKYGKINYFHVSIPHRKASDLPSYPHILHSFGVSIPHRKASDGLIQRFGGCGSAFQFLIGKLVTRSLGTPLHLCVGVSIPHRKASDAT